MIHSITHKPPYIFLKTATLPTYYGISIAIPRYIAMKLPPSRHMTCVHCHIALHDHIADIVFVAQPPATGSLRWYFLEEERMMQYCRDKYFPQLRTKVINPVGE